MEFTEGLQKLFRLEGEGYEPNLDGGTYSGITQATYDHYRAFCGLTLQSVGDISQSEISEIYYRNYWLPLYCQQLPDGIDFAVFQAGVNQGVGTAAKMLQRIVGAKVDGYVGPQTIARVQAYVTANGTQALADAYFAAQKATYSAVIAANPDKEIYWQGWLNRIESTSAMISDALSSAVTAIASNPGSAVAVAMTAGLIFFSC